MPYFSELKEDETAKARMTYRILYHHLVSVELTPQIEKIQSSLKKGHRSKADLEAIHNHPLMKTYATLLTREFTQPLAR